MLRAIAGYFFGGAVEEVPQIALECDTREVNDWLVVNMADRPEDNIDMEEEIEVDLVVPDDEYDVDIVPDKEYDEILDAISCLMTEEYENNGFISDENCSEADDTDSQSWSKSEEISSDESDDDRMSVSSDTDSVGSGFGRSHLMDLDDRLIFKPFLFFNLPIAPRALDVSNEIVQTFGRKDCKSYVTPRKLVIANQNSNIKYPIGTDGLIDYEKAVKVYTPSEYMSQTKAIRYTCIPARDVLPKVPSKVFIDLFADFEEMFNRSREAKNPYLKKRCHQSSTTCHPVYSKTYVNHRNPALANKSEIMQKIKQLEVEQVQEYKIKKFISKGQINRQNKNYIFESSCKKNRRKNLQRNPSGANNNRKC